jgi:light-regulated signal transduction histidine kinase (bacteriophytochrome)
VTLTKLEDRSPSVDDLREFIFAISHDLREPLRTVSYHASNLAGLAERDNRAIPEISGIQGAAKRMLRLLDDTAAYVEAGGPLVLGPMDAEEALRAARSNLDALIQAEGAVIDQESLPVVHGEFEYLVRLFQNLLANALKFRRKEDPRVHVGCSTTSAGWLFSVRDNGIGIPPECHEFIFRAFKRLHSRCVYPGTGLGLTICRRIVALHGGRLWLDSAVGKGSTFFFTIAKPE